MGYREYDGRLCSMYNCFNIKNEVLERGVIFGSEGGFCDALHKVK